MDDVRRCLYCGAELNNRRPEAKFCKPAHGRKYRRRRQSSNSIPEPPTPPGNSRAQDIADRVFRQQWAAEDARAAPETPEIRAARAWERRNPGVQHPLLAQMHVDAELERRKAAEEAQATRAMTIAEKGRLDRQRQRSNATYTGQYPGPSPWNDEPQTVQAPAGRNTPRWATSQQYPGQS